MPIEADIILSGGVIEGDIYAGAAVMLFTGSLRLLPIDVDRGQFLDTPPPALRVTLYPVVVSTGAPDEELPVPVLVALYPLQASRGQFLQNSAAPAPLEIVLDAPITGEIVLDALLTEREQPPVLGGGNAGTILGEDGAQLTWEDGSLILLEAA